jgi:hypothetical protein
LNIKPQQRTTRRHNIDYSLFDEEFDYISEEEELRKKRDTKKVNKLPQSQNSVSVEAKKTMLPSQPIQGLV